MSVQTARPGPFALIHALDILIANRKMENKHYNSGSLSSKRLGTCMLPCVRQGLCWLYHVVDTTCADIAGLRNECFTPLYASPELLQRVGSTCPHMADRPNDLWALGVMLHGIFTCASPNWQSAFHPSSQDKAAGQEVPAAQRGMHTAQAIAQQ